MSSAGLPSVFFMGSLLMAIIAGAGLLQALAGLYAVQRFATQRRADPLARPAVTILKPLHGNEPMLEQALATFCTQTYPHYQIVFGVHSADDAAIATVAALRQRYPPLDIDLVIDNTRHGANPKISNLINMLSAGRHGILVVADSDVHAAPDYLDRIVAALQLPRTGVVTTLYSGLPAFKGPVGALGSQYISHAFLPGALLARGLGRQDCLGATMALRAETLAAIGGFAAIADHLADDARLGQLVAKAGLAVRLAATVPATTVPETSLAALFAHELRWARTIRALAPVGHLLSMVQFPIFWSLLAALLAGGAWWAIAVMGICWLTRAAVSRRIDTLLNLHRTARGWLLPLRDVLSMSVIVASYAGGEVHWRGQVMRAGPPVHGQSVTKAGPARRACLLKAES